MCIVICVCYVQGASLDHRNLKTVYTRTTAKVFFFFFFFYGPPACEAGWQWLGLIVRAPHRGSAKVFKNVFKLIQRSVLNFAPRGKTLNPRGKAVPWMGV
jgi:hypothetical protein